VKILREDFNVLKNHAKVLLITEQINLIVFTDFDLFFAISVTIEPIFPEWTLVGVHLVIVLTIRAFECM